MKRFLSLLLAFAVCFTLLATTSLADYLGEYTKNPADYDQMLDCVNKGSYNIQLTQEYFAINPTEYKKGNYCKFKFESNGAEVQAAVFLMPGEFLSAIGTSTTLLTETPIAFSPDAPQELDCSGNRGAVNNGAYFGFNILTTSLSVDTTITVSVYCTNTGNGTFDKVDEITYELEAAEQVSDETLGMSVECADHSETETGKQVYAGDTVEVSFTGADKFNGTSALFSFDDTFELVSGAPDGWTKQNDGGYLYEKSDTTPDDLGEFVLKVMAPSGESGTGTLTLSNRFSSSEPVDTTETLYVIGKPIQYTITGLGSNNAVTVVYDGQPRHIEVVVTEPDDAVIQYSTTSPEDILDGKPTVWQDSPPEWVDVSFDQPVAGYNATTIKITADGYKTVQTSVNLAITPAQLTITPKNVTLNVGDALPTTFEYDITGLVGGDKLKTEPTITCLATDTNTPGTYTLTASGASAGDNYTITYATGKLTVKDVWIVKLDDTEYKVVKGEDFTFPKAPTKPGCIFLGWRGADGATYQPGEEVAISGDTSFKAVWANMPDVTPGGGDEPDVDVFPFYDVSVNAWYYDAVKYAWEHELMNGVSATQFSPNTTLNRAMIWTMLARLDGVNTDGGANWYAKAQEWAMAEGVSDGTDPMGAVTREQLVTMLWRFKGEPTVDFLLTSPDADTISDWAREAMRWAVSNGIIEGDENGCITPTATATRAQAAAIFMRFVEQ